MAREARRVLFVTRNFPPLKGGMERLNHRIYLALQSVYRMSFCGPIGSKSHVEVCDIYREMPVSPLWLFLVSCQFSTWYLARKFKPKVIYSGSGLTAPAVWLAGVLTNAKTVCYLHGLDIVADHPIYRLFFLRAIRKIDKIIVNSSNTAELAVAAGIRPDSIEIVHPGVKLPDVNLAVDAKKRFRNLISAGDRPILLIAGRLTQRKGVAEFIRFGLPEIRLSFPDVLLVIIGEEATSALKHRSGVTEGILRAAQSDGAGGVVLLGAVSDDVLSDAYFAADVMVFPVLDLPGDVEGFGMVALEAAAHGLPTVAFAVGGVPDAVKHGGSGFLARSGNYSEFSQYVLTLLVSRQDVQLSCHFDSCVEYARGFTWDIFSDRFLKFFHNVTECESEAAG